MDRRLAFFVLVGCASNDATPSEDDTEDVTAPTDTETDADTDSDTDADADTDADTDTVVGCDHSVLGGSVPAPVAFWSFDAATMSASTVDDLEGTAGGTLVGGPTPTVGACAEGLSLDGVDDLVQIDNEAAFDFDVGDPFTIAAWVKVEPGAFGPVLFGKSDNDVAPGGSPGYYLGVRTPADNYGTNLDLVNDPGDLGRRVQTVDGVVDSTWHHVVAIYDGSNTVAGISFVVDGVAAATSVILNTNPGSILNDVKPAIGARGTGAVSLALVACTVDEVGVWDVALTDAEAIALYSALTQ